MGMGNGYAQWGWEWGMRMWMGNDKVDEDGEWQEDGNGDEHEEWDTDGEWE